MTLAWVLEKRSMERHAKKDEPGKASKLAAHLLLPRLLLLLPLRRQRLLLLLLPLWRYCLVKDSLVQQVVQGHRPAGRHGARPAAPPPPKKPL
jgi:hypothetical protein